jgi:Zn-dependent peptidase ImmA (M78 family)
MSQLSSLIDEFVCLIKNGTIDIYNEYSLQHELGIFLRHKLTNYKVQFERNVSFFFDRHSNFTKREIDIAIFPKESLHPRHAIELKFPRNGQYPEQMFSFCKDIVLRGA